MLQPDLARAWVLGGTELWDETKTFGGAGKFREFSAQLNELAVVPMEKRSSGLVSV